MDTTKREKLKQLIKYVFTGGSAFVIEQTIFYFLDKAVSANIAHTIAYTITFWFTFFMNRKFTFNSKGSFWQQLLKYILLYAFNLTVTNLLLHLLVSPPLSLHHLLAKIIVSGLVVLWNFPLYKFVIYK